MTRRKPTVPERARLARAAVDYIGRHIEKEPDQEPYDLAYRGLGPIEWLPAQSRDGIAAYAAKCWTCGEEPYAGMTDVDLEDAERGWQAHAQQHGGRSAGARNTLQLDLAIDAPGHTGPPCAGATKSGRPCGIAALPGRNLCHIHAPELQCGALKSNGRRCAVATGGRGPCAAHR